MPVQFKTIPEEDPIHMKVLRLKVNQYSCGNQKRTAANIQSKNKPRSFKILFARFNDSGFRKFEKSVVV